MFLTWDCLNSSGRLVKNIHSIVGLNDLSEKWGKNIFFIYTTVTNIPNGKIEKLDKSLKIHSFGLHENEHNKLFQYKCFINKNICYEK